MGHSFFLLFFFFLIDRGIRVIIFSFKVLFNVLHEALGIIISFSKDMQDLFL